METKLTAGFGLLLGFAVGIFVASFAIISKSIDTELAINQRHTVLQELKTARSMMDKAEALTRAYIIKPSDSYMGTFNIVILSIPKHLTSISTLMPETDRDGMVTQLRDSLNRQTGQLQLVMQERQQDGFDAAKAHILKIESSHERQNAAALFDKLELDQKTLLSQQLADSESRFSNAIVLFGLLGVIVFGGFLWLVHRMYSGMMYQKSIEQTLEHRAVELTALNERLIESERIKGEFVATVSHELRTPLTLILAPLESLLSDERLSPDQKSHLQTMHNNTVRLLQLISGLLDFSKLDARQVEVKREPLSVTSLVSSVLSDFQPAIEKKELKLLTEFQEPSPVVEMDRYLLERILFNLISNAIKFTPEGGDIAVSVNWKHDHLFIRVRDSGIGIPPAEIDLIFQKFRQVEAPSTRRFEGTGLGLAIVSEFAALLGGTVTVRSVEGQGSTFAVEVAAPQSDSRARDESKVNETGGRLAPRFVPETSASVPDNPDLPRVLVAEDNAELSSYIATVLQEFCAVRTVRNGREALDVIAGFRPDAVLTDVMMPELDGLSLCKEIKADHQTSRIPVVLLTALTNREALLRGWEAGADEYLFKPFHPKELAIRISTILKGVADRKRADALALKQQKADQTRDFMSTLAHDMQVPLLGSSRVFEMLLKGQLGAVPDEVTELIEQIQEKNKWLLRLTEMLLEVYRYESGTKELEFTDVPIADLLSSSLRNIKNRTDTAKINAGCQAAMGLIVRGDRQALSSLFEQIIDNAVKNTPEGGEIKVSASSEDDFVSIEVFNSGSYLSEEVRNNLFDRFWRGQPGKKFVQNTGLGLYLCKRIVDAHRGSISFVSDKKTGTTFQVKLSARSSPENASPQAGDAQVLPLAAGSILNIQEVSPND